MGFVGVRVNCGKGERERGLRSRRAYYKHSGTEVSWFIFNFLLVITDSNNISLKRANSSKVLKECFRKLSLR